VNTGQVSGVPLELLEELELELEELLPEDELDDEEELLELAVVELPLELDEEDALVVEALLLDEALAAAVTVDEDATDPLDEVLLVEPVAVADEEELLAFPPELLDEEPLP
jgi:hypothetical protein